MLSLWLYCFLGILTATKSLARPDTSPVRKLARQQNPPDTTINYTFDATSSRNIAVYFGRTNATSTTTLFAQCADPNIDLVILAFVTNVFAGGGYPSISFDGLCGNRTTEMRREGASGLLSCSGLAEQVVRCQGLGKKVLLAVGGQNGNVTFSSTSRATKAAEMLWNIFGGGTALDVGLRPFGNVTVDGFDINNETGNGDHYIDFLTSLRTLFATTQQSPTSNRKTYYLSAAPSCSFPDPSQPLAALHLADFVWPQFYSAPSCNIGSDGFGPSFSAWSARLADTNTSARNTKLYIGAPAFAAAVVRSNGDDGGGYQDPDAFAGTVKTAKALAKKASNNFGGVMLWDGAYAHITKDGEGRDFVNVTKEALVLSNDSVSFRQRPWEKTSRLSLAAVGLATGVAWSGIVG